MKPRVAGHMCTRGNPLASVLFSVVTIITMATVYHRAMLIIVPLEL